MKGRQPSETRYWPEVFASYRHNVGNDRHNLNACQHKWRELRPKLDRFKAYYDSVPGNKSRKPGGDGQHTVPG
ncbi:hypothetical protein Hanom_Chr12g01121601 [Helianthus anomalus]